MVSEYVHPLSDDETDRSGSRTQNYCVDEAVVTDPQTVYRDVPYTDHALDRVPTISQDHEDDDAKTTKAAHLDRLVSALDEDDDVENVSHSERKDISVVIVLWCPSSLYSSLPTATKAINIANLKRIAPLEPRRLRRLYPKTDFYSLVLEMQWVLEQSHWWD